MWMAFTEDGTPISGSEHEDDPAMCMLYLMQHMPKKVALEYLKWMNMRDARAEAAVRALFDPAVASKLKEEYLEFVARYIENVGYYKVLYNTITIKWVDMEGDE